MINSAMGVERTPAEAASGGTSVCADCWPGVQVKPTRQWPTPDPLRGLRRRRLKSEIGSRESKVSSLERDAARKHIEIVSALSQEKAS